MAKKDGCPPGQIKRNGKCARTDKKALLTIKEHLEYLINNPHSDHEYIYDGGPHEELIDNVAITILSTGRNVKGYINPEKREE